MPKKNYQPPFEITAVMLRLVAEISEMLGRWSVSLDAIPSPALRRTNRLRTIQASLAIENNTLSLKQVTDILEGKQVLGSAREIQEVKNAIAAYEQMDAWQISSCDDLLLAHQLLMKGLVENPGEFRNRGVGIYREGTLVHMPPPANRVPILIRDLLAWLANTNLHPLISSCLFHYEFEFIHPFADGNGRMGRLWQTLILSRLQSVWLAYLPVETVIKARQNEYYQALTASDKASDATVFIEFMLQALHRAIAESSEKSSEKGSEKTDQRILKLLTLNKTMTISELAKTLKLSTRTIEKQLNKLKSERKLQRIGAAKGGYWQVLVNKN